MESLYSKAKALLDRMMFRSTETKMHEYEQFLKNEIKPEDLVHYFSTKDLAEIHSRACHLASTVSYGEEVNGERVFSNPALLQSFCYFQAVYGQLRARGLIPHQVKLGDQKDENRKNSI